MKVNLDRLKALWQEEERQDFCKRWKRNPSPDDIRFDKLTEIIDKLATPKCTVKVESESQVNITVDNSSINLDGWSTKKFGPMQDNLPDASALYCMKNLLDKIDKTNPDDNEKHELKRLLFDVWSLLGFPVKDIKDLEDNNFKIDFKIERKPEWRIMSNALTKGKDSSSSLAITKSNPDAHFASNNHFFQIIRLVNMIAAEEEQKTIAGLIGDDNDLVPLVLRYPDSKKEATDLATEANSQRDILKTRFPLKFLWMWAQKDKLIVPISLLGFSRLCQSELYKDILEKLSDGDKNSGDVSLTEPSKNIIDDDYDDFVMFWQAFSDKLFEELGITQCSQACSDSKESPQLILSKLLSSLLLDSEDRLRLTELIQKGSKAIILYGPPGTGKTYEAEKIAEWLTKSVKEQKSIVQFHPSYSYEDFIEGIRPEVKNGGVAYEIHDGHFKKFCSDAATALRTSKKPDGDSPAYVFIADEINRANLSDVLGELLYCLEYRNKEIKLPISKNDFLIPENVYFIGTMNNVDKSLVTFDMALRRRFIWYYLEPDPTKLFDEALLGDSVEKESLKQFVTKCKELNVFITNEEKGFGLDEQYQIGHAYFYKIKDFFKIPDSTSAQNEKSVISESNLEDLWQYHLKPLLDEYLVTQERMEGIKEQLSELKEKFVKAP